MLKDWLFYKNESDPVNKGNKNKDIKSIGMVVAEAATLIPAA